MTVPVSSQTLYAHATVITVNAKREILLDGAILINGNEIVAIDKTPKLVSVLSNDVTIVDCSNKIIIPGLINTHVHLVQSLMRGLAEDLPLYSWLCDAIWKLEANLREDDGYIAAKLTIAEMLKSGTTCFLEAMMTHQANIDNVVRAVGEMGIRACLGKLVKSVETNVAVGITDARDDAMKSMSLKSAVNSYDKYHGSFHDRLHIWFAAGSPRGASINDYSKIGNMAKSRNIGMTMHCAEAPNDNNLYHEHYGCSPLEFCQKANLTSNKTVLAHVVHPDPHPDFQILAETGTTVSHNPTSNCKLGSGISPIPDMLAAGVNVAIGTDGAPCNNTYDMIREMHLTSIVHSGARQKAGAIDPYTILEMATINGARALGLEGSIGTLEVGKKADFVVINPNSLHSTPWDATQVQQGGIDPITVVVHSCSGSDVELVVIDGQIVVEQGQITGFDEKQLMVDARERIASLRKRSGVSARNHTNVNFI